MDMIDYDCVHKENENILLIFSRTEDKFFKKNVLSIFYVQKGETGNLLTLYREFGYF